MKGSDQRLFCFGLGYSALRLAQSLADQGWSIAGTCRDPKQYDQLTGRGYEIWRFDRDTPLPSACDALEHATHIVSSIPPDAEGDPVVDVVGPRLGGCNDLVWAGYLSTTGVYGDTGGEWVDEHSELKPTNARSQCRVLAEQAWITLFAELALSPPHVFRLAGIYGPGRSAIEVIRAGRAHRIDKPGHVFSRIHVDDLVAILQASMGLSQTGTVYNVCDDEPAPQEQVIAFACALLGVDVPPLMRFEDADLSEMARSFYADNRRVRNDRVKTAHGLRLQYPTYRAGLRSIASLTC